MASAKGKGRKPDKGDGEGVVESGVGAVDNHGPCKDCGKPVDCVVEIHQCVGSNRFVCVECRAGRMKADYETKVGLLISKAEKCREDMRQLTLDLGA